MAIHTGAGAPELNLGSVGDLYLNTEQAEDSAGELYFKSDFSTWSLIPTGDYSPDDPAAWWWTDPPVSVTEALNQAAYRMFSLTESVTTILGQIVTLSARLTALETRVDALDGGGGGGGG